MKKTILIPYLLGIFLSFNMHVAFADSVNLKNDTEIFNASLSYLMDNRQHREALKQTNLFLKKYPQSPVGLRNKGLVLLKLNQNKEALQAFEMASLNQVDPSEKAVDNFLAARTAISMKQFKKAKSVLEVMRNDPRSSNFAERALVQLESSKSIPIPDPDEFKEKVVAAEPVSQMQTKAESESSVKRISANVTFGSDSNPVFIPDGTQGKNDAASTFVSTGLTWKINPQSETFRNTFTLGLTEYSAEAAKSFNNFRWSFGTELRVLKDILERRKISLQNSFEQSYQTYPEFNYYYSSDTLTTVKQFDPVGRHDFSTSISLGYRAYANKTLTSPENNRDGFTFGLRGNYKLSNDFFPWTNSIGYSETQTAGIKFNTKTYDIATNFQQMVSDYTEILYGLSYSHTSYPNNTDKSTDRNLGLGVDLVQTFRNFSGLTMKLSLSRSKNDSDAASSTYTQDIMSIWVNYDL